MQRGAPSFSGAEARSLVHDPDNNGVSEGVWVHNAIPRRHSNFDQQRSRSNSTASQSTLKARPQRASYQESKTSNPWNPMGDADTPPVPALKRISNGDGTGTPKNFSRRTSFHRENSGNAQQNLTENEVPPPVPSNPNGGDLASAERQANQQSNPSSGNAQQNLTEKEVPPPVPSHPNGGDLASAERQANQQSDLERNTMQSPDSGPPFAARRAEDYLHKSPLPSRPSDWLTTLYTISHLIFFSIFGTLARLGVQWFSFYPGTPILTPVIWANVGGSLVMGFLTEDRQLFRDEWMTRERLHPDRKSIKDGNEPGELSASERNKIKKTVPLYVGLAVGFCGSFTSFSSFMRDTFLALSNDLPAPVNHPSTGTISTSAEVSRNGGYSFIALLAVIISTLALSLGALVIGAHVALALDSITPRMPSRFTRRILDPLMVFLGFGCWLGALFLSIWPPDRHSSSTENWRGISLLPILFAPTGCLLRYYVSIKLNGLVPSFPLGTFAANMFGTAIQGMCYDLQHVGIGVNGAVGGGLAGCQVLQGVQDGFCGCSTTVSTWVGEINGLRRRSAYLYAVASVLGGLGLMVVIMGSVRWSVGWSSPVCDTGYVSKI